MNTIGQRWVALRFVTARYFKTAESFLEGCNQAKPFNVYRKPDDDLNNKSVWDDGKAIVGLSRIKASLWIAEPPTKKGRGPVGKVPNI